MKVMASESTEAHSGTWLWPQNSMNMNLMGWKSLLNPIPVIPKSFDDVESGIQIQKSSQNRTIQSYVKDRYLAFRQKHGFPEQYRAKGDNDIEFD